MKTFFSMGRGRLNSSLTASILGVIAAVACQTEGLDEPSGEPAGRELRINTTIIDSRAATDESYHTSFEPGDSIGLFAVLRKDPATQSYPQPEGNYIQNARFVRQEDGSWKETGSKSYSPEEGNVLDVYAYYPYAADADPTALEYDAAVNPVDFMTSRATGIKAPFEEVNLVFRHKLVLVEGDIAGDDRLTDRTVKMSNVKTSATFSLAATSQSGELVSVDEKTDGASVLHNGMTYQTYLPEQTISKGTHIFTVSSANADYEYTAPREAQLQTGAVKKFLIAPLPDDSSMEPNSYIIKPGDILYIPVAKMIDIWKSNGVLSAASSGLFAGAMGAEVLWIDHRYLLSNDDLSILGKGRNAVIQVKTTKELGEGNAVVALRVDGIIRWSWHIWITDYNPNDPGLQHNLNGKVFMDRNIGALSPAIGDPLSFGLQYQWGRKDPIPTPSSWGESSGKALWDGNNKSVGFDSKIAVADVLTNLTNSITSPTSVIQADGDPYDWYTLESSGDNIGDDRWDNDGKKTGFDPCPRGWRVPVSKPFESAWAGCTAANGVWSYGYYWPSPDAGYWPAVGYRTSSGTWNYIGEIGYYWGASPVHETSTYGTKSGGSGFYFDSHAVLENYKQFRFTVMSVRCVKE